MNRIVKERIRMKKVFVGNINYNTTEEELKDAFSECGNVAEVKIIKDFETGKSKGFAFVSLGDDSSLQAALKLNGKDVNGREIRVNEAFDKKK